MYDDNQVRTEPLGRPDPLLNVWWHSWGERPDNVTQRLELIDSTMVSSPEVTRKKGKRVASPNGAQAPSKSRPTPSKSTSAGTISRRATGEDEDQQPQRHIERNNPLRRLIQDIISIVDQVSVVRSGILKRKVIDGKPIMTIQIAGSKGKHLLSHSNSIFKEVFVSKGCEELEELEQKQDIELETDQINELEVFETENVMMASAFDSDNSED